MHEFVVKETGSDKYIGLNSHGEVIFTSQKRQAVIFQGEKKHLDEFVKMNGLSYCAHTLVKEKPSNYESRV